MKNKRLYIILAGIPTLLLIPFIAMFFSKEVSWALTDFMVMGILLLLTGLTIELILRIIKGNSKRTILIVALVVIFLLVWAELGVGIFGTPFAGD